MIVNLSQLNPRRGDKEAGKERMESKEGSRSSSCCFSLPGLSHLWIQECCDRRHETPARPFWLWTEHTLTHTHTHSSHALKDL